MRVTISNQVTMSDRLASNNYDPIGRIAVAVAKTFLKKVPAQTKAGIDIGAFLGGAFGPATPITVPFFAAFGGVVGTLFWAMGQK
jgi:hypothetical protein